MFELPYLQHENNDKNLILCLKIPDLLEENNSLQPTCLYINMNKLRRTFSELIT